MRPANLFDMILARLGRLRRFRVEGDSMLPTLKDGDQVLVRPGLGLQTGDIVASLHPFKRTVIIKRVKEFSTGGKLFLTGDNPQESTDSRSFGELSEKDIIGKVICRLDP